MPDTIPILLDTDIGCDIDDAVALAYLLRHPRCELLGITTVSGDVAQRAACAEAVCRAAGQPDIPIHLGRSDVLCFGPGQPKCPHYSAIENLGMKMDRPRDSAVEFLRQTIRQRPGEITLLSIGPMSNMGLLMAIDPEIPSLLKEWVCMAGWFYGEEGRTMAEWNCRVDPISTAIAFKAYGPQTPMLSVGLDVTMKCRMPLDEIRRRFVKEPLSTVLAMAEVWFSHSKKSQSPNPPLTFHDPLAAALIFNPGICTYEQGTITVDALDPVQGRTVFTQGAGKHRVAKEVNASAFFEEYYSVFR